MKSLKGIASFIAVASSGSFAVAAKQQGVSAVAVSKNVATLERQIAVRLFQRTTRKLSLTAEGQLFYNQCLGPLRDLEAAVSSVEQSTATLSGLVRVTSVSPIASGYLVPLLPAFHKANPRVQIELHLDDALSDMVANEYDIGIRVGELHDSTRVARPIAAMPFVICASPGYLRLRGKPDSLAQLTQHNCLRMRRTGRDTPFPWFAKGLDAAANQQIRGNFSANDFGALVTAAVQDQGLICTPLPLAMPLFRSGQLRPVLTQFVDPQFTIYLHYPNRKNLPARTRSFIDFVIERLRLESDLQTPAHELLAPFV